MPARTGNQYIKAIDNLHPTVWVDGNKVNGKMSEHPAFSGVMKSQAALYDLQHKKDKKEVLTYPSPTAGDPVGISFLPPKTKKELKKRRDMIQTWAKQTAGLMGRSPDYMNTALMTFGVATPLLAEQSDKCANNMKQYYEYCRDYDIALTHTFVQPQVNRSQLHIENPSEVIAARIIDENKQGIIIHGARLLATQGGITDEIMVFPSGAQLSRLDKDYAFAFAIPNNTKGLKFICRESFDYGKSPFDHPLGSRFEEMDTIVVFDHVLVPWERIFIHRDVNVNNKLYSHSSFFPHVTHQVVCRNVVKTEFVLGVVQSMVDAINIEEYQHVQEKISEVIIALETMKSLLLASEANAKKDRWGLMTPHEVPLQVAITYFPRIYPRFSEIIQLLGASGLVSIPGEKDFEGDLHEELEKYLQSATLKGKERVKLFRLAWDLSMSAFGSRQTLYERFFFGDPIRLSQNLCKKYNRKSYTDWVQEFLKT